MADGVRIAPVAEGLAFAITVSKAGVVMGSGRFELSVPGQTGRLALRFEQLEVQAGRLTGLARLVNRSEAELSGLRLDFTTRASMSSPLWFGALKAGEESAGVAFLTTPIAFEGDAPYSVVLGVVTGAVALGEVPPEPTPRPTPPGRAPRKPTPKPAPNAVAARPCAPGARGATTAPPEKLGAVLNPSTCVTDGRLSFVLDRGGSAAPARIVVFDSESRHLRTFAEGTLNGVTEITLDPRGDLIATRTPDQPRVKFALF